MKRLAMLLVVLSLAGLPLAAAALDYGPSQLLAAADRNAPQLPSPGAHAATMDATPKPDLADTAAGDATAAAPAPAGAPRAHAAPNGIASNKPQPHTAKPAPQPTQASWQSLLPGSIQ